MKTPNEFFELIREKGLTTGDAQELFTFNQSTYDMVVTLLMTDSGDYETSLSGYPWRCQTAGCRLFTMRPNHTLYDVVLRGSLKIADPSSCRDAVDALLQVKSKGNVALDFLKLIELNKTDPDADETISRVFSMFYWLGMTPNNLMSNWRAWLEFYEEMYGKFINEHDMPVTEPDEAIRVSGLIVETMLDLFEANNSNQTARGVIASLTLLDKDSLLPYRERLSRAFASASQSADEYVRHRVSLHDFRQLIDEFKS